MDCTHAALVTASFVVATISEFSFATIGFGPAILYQISWQLLAIAGISGGGLAEAVGNIIVIEAPTGIFQMWNLRKHIRWRLAFHFNMAYAVVLPLGTLALERFGQSLWMKRGLGVLLLLLALGQLLQRLRNRSERPAYPPGRPSLEAEPRSWSTVGAIALASAASGLMRGLFGVAGPAIMVLLMYFPVDPAKFRCVAATNRVIAVVIQGVTLGLHDDIRPVCWRTYCALMLGGLLGVVLGNKAARHVDASAFQRWVLLFLASGALLMLSAGAKAASLAAAALVGLALLSALLLPLASAARRKLAARAEMNISLNELPRASCGDDVEET